MSKRRVREVIVVEGRYDKNTVRQAVDATVIETNGFGIFTDSEKAALLRRLAEARGLIILTDSDSAGFFIRGRLKSMLGGANIRHAYVPDIRGRERRKREDSREGLLGVEGMRPEVIIEALERAGANFDDSEETQEHGGITKADFYELGLTGSEGSSERRRKLAESLGFPAKMPANALLEVLNALYSKIEFYNMYNNR